MFEKIDSTVLAMFQNSSNQFEEKTGRTVVFAVAVLDLVLFFFIAGTSLLFAIGFITPMGIVMSFAAKHPLITFAIASPFLFNALFGFFFRERYQAMAREKKIKDTRDWFRNTTSFQLSRVFGIVVLLLGFVISMSLTFLTVLAFPSLEAGHRSDTLEFLFYLWFFFALFFILIVREYLDLCTPLPKRLLTEEIEDSDEVS